MGVYYDRAFKVPAWFVVKLADEKQLAVVVKWFEDAEAHNAAWPAASFKASCEALARKGWAHALMLKDPYIMRDDVLVRAAGDHVKNFFGSHAFLARQMAKPLHHLDRRIRDDSDYERVFNGVLFLQPIEAVCKLFKTAERTLYDARKTKVFVTYNNPAIDVLTRMAERVITIGPDESSSIVIAPDDKRKEIKDKLDTFAEQLFT